MVYITKSQDSREHESLLPLDISRSVRAERYLLQSVAKEALPGERVTDELKDKLEVMKDQYHLKTV